jgi:copper ion binding protein
MTIKNELSELEGVKSVEGDPENKIIMVEWEEPTTLKDIEQTLEDINYPVSSWPGARIRYLKGGDPMANHTITLPVGGMTCANCAINIEKGIKKLSGVFNTNVNFAAEQAVIAFDPKQSQCSPKLTRNKREVLQWQNTLESS